MRRIVLAFMFVLFGILMASFPSYGWTREDCQKVNFNHPDCAKFSPTPVPHATTPAPRTATPKPKTCEDTDTCIERPTPTPARTVAPPRPTSSPALPTFLPAVPVILIPHLPSTSTD